MKTALPEFVIEKHRTIRSKAVRLKRFSLGRSYSKPGWGMNEFVGFRCALRQPTSLIGKGRDTLGGPRRKYQPPELFGRESLK